MRILITGASGFVGGHLAEFLKTKTNYLAGTYRTLRPKTSQISEWVQSDFSFFDQVVKTIQKTKPTHIFHLIGQSSPSLSWSCPLETVRDNVFSAFHLMEACRTLNVKPKILLVSSAHVYGKAQKRGEGPSEKDIPKPMDPYGHTKLQAEAFAREYWKYFKIPTVITRASAHIGPGQPTVFAISNFCKQIAEIEKGKRRPVIIVGNLKAERGFVAVEDMVRAHWIALQQGNPGEIYNVAASQVRPMGEWLDLLLKLTPAEIKIKTDPARLRLVESPRILVNSQKFRRMSGWHETIAPETAFRNVLNWWRNHV